MEDVMKQCGDAVGSSDSFPMVIGLFHRGEKKKKRQTANCFDSLAFDIDILYQTTLSAVEARNRSTLDQIKF